MLPLPYTAIDDWQDFHFIRALREYAGKYTPSRIDRDTVPKGMYAYDIQSQGAIDGLWQKGCVLRDWTAVNFEGTFVTPVPVLLNKEGYAKIKEWWFV